MHSSDSQSNVKDTGNATEDSPLEQTEVSLERREAIARLVKAAAYAAPATLALLSMEAKACSLTC